MVGKSKKNHHWRTFLDNDFGFTAIDEAEIKDDTRIEQMYKLIRPLLDNLMKNPEKDYIKWPKRDQIIKKMIEELEGIRNVD